MALRCLRKAMCASGIAFCVGFPSAAHADDSRFYLGAEDLALSRIKVKGSSLRAAGLDVSGSKKNKSETGYRIFGGYQFDPHLAIEAGYGVIGDYGFATLVPGGSVRVESMEVHTWNLDAVARWPIWDTFSLHGRLGVVRSETDVSVVTTGTAVAPRRHRTENDWGYNAGVGAGWDPHKNFGMRIGWELYRVADGLGSHANVELLTWGVRIKF